MKTHLLFTSASLVTALLLASCANGPDAEMDPEAAYPITVGPHMQTLTVMPGAGSQEQVAAFASDFVASGNGSITVSAPTPDAARAVADRLASSGVPRDRITMGAPQGPAVHLSYVGYGATSPACMNWSQDLDYTENNLPTPNFGCSTQHNLAVEIADPRDLVSPQAMTPPDTERRMTVIDKWRRGEPTSSQKTQEQSGAVSDVAHQ